MELLPAIILIVVAAIAGYGLGIVDSRLTEAAKKKLAESKTPAPVPEAEKASQPPQEQNLRGEHTVLKMTVDLALKWHLELDGARIPDSQAMSAEQRQRLVNVVVQMRPWIDGKSAPVAAPAPEVPVAPVRPVAQVPASMVPPVPVPVAGPPPKVDMVRGFRSLLNNEVKNPEASKPKSIVAMIDEVLQAKLIGSPLFARGIRLEEGPLGEVMVFVGQQRYSGVDAVPDPEVQALIRSAIADWEKK
jgi:hypothetical protein